MRETKPAAIILVVICSFVAAIAQLFYKIGASRLQLNLFALLTNYHLIIGIILYLITAALLTLSLKNGKLSVLYPIIALGYIWVALLSIFFLGERVSVIKWLGIATIIAGVSLIGIGSDK